MFALLLERKKKKLPSKPWQRFTRTSQLTDSSREESSDENHHDAAAIILLLTYLQNCIYFIFFIIAPFLNVSRLSAGLELGLELGLGLSTVAFSSSTDQKRLLLASSLPLTYLYSVTFEFHNCSPTFITANFGQGYHEALQRFLRCASVNESRCCLQQVVQRTAQTQ